MLRRKPTCTLIAEPAAPGQRARQLASAGVPVRSSLAKLASTSMEVLPALSVTVANGNTRLTYSRRPPLSKNARAAYAR